MIANIQGTIHEFEASIYNTWADLVTAEIGFWFNPASIDTGDAKRDELLKNTDFFDVATFKETNLVSNPYRKWTRMAVKTSIAI